MLARRSTAAVAVLRVAVASSVAGMLVVGCAVEEPGVEEPFDPGYETSNVFVASLELSEAAAAPDLDEELSALPGVDRVTYATAIPAEPETLAAAVEETVETVTGSKPSLETLEALLGI